jgi:hypothetical protein
MVSRLFPASIEIRSAHINSPISSAAKARIGQKPCAVQTPATANVGNATVRTQSRADLGVNEQRGTSSNTRAALSPGVAKSVGTGMESSLMIKLGLYELPVSFENFWLIV